MKVGLNGSVVDADQAVISVYDHGFLYGLGLFETFRTYGGKAYLLDRHLNRLQGGCAELGIRYDRNAQEIEQWVRMVLDANGLEDGYVRLTVSAGEAELGLPSSDYDRPSALVLVKALPEANDDALMRGRELRLLHTKRNTPEGDVRFKSLHYMNNIIARRELLGLGIGPGVEGLMLSREGWLTEGIVSNLFFVKEGVVRTPAIATGILPGVTRQRVLELAEAAGYRTEEGFYYWEELAGADEIWMTNSIQELVPITTLTDAAGVSRAVGDAHGSDRLGFAGEITRKLLALYRSDTVS